MLDADDLRYLRRCVELAAEALDAGDEPFGSLLVGADGKVLFEDRNRVAGDDRTRHPELELARWAAVNLTPEERRGTTVYTSGEHCPMCAAAHGWVETRPHRLRGLVGAAVIWLTELGAAPPSVRPLPIREVVPDAEVDGPAPDLAEEVRALHARSHGA